MKNILILILALVSSIGFAQKDSKIETSFIGLEIDPAPFLLSGYSLSLKYSPAQIQHLSIMTSIFSSDFPNKMLQKVNTEKGFQEFRFNPSYAIFTDYFFSNERMGVHFGPSVFLYNNSVGHSEYNERADFKTLYPNLRVGYTFKPFKKSGLYFDFWGNVGTEINLDDKNIIEGDIFEASSFKYIMAIHLGYSYEF